MMGKKVLLCSIKICTNYSYKFYNFLLSSTIRFQLMMSRFQYPTPCTDKAPNGVMMSIPGDTPLAYYAPLANTNWPGFNTSNMSLNIDGVEIPVLSPQPNQLIESSVCVWTTLLIVRCWRLSGNKTTLHVSMTTGTLILTSFGLSLLLYCGGFLIISMRDYQEIITF